MSLDLRSTVQRLQKYSNSSFPILSVYLEVKNDQDLLKEFQATLERTLVERDYAMLEKNITYIEGFLLDYKPSNKDQGLALFSGGDELFEALVTHFTLPTLVSVDYSPYLVPLYDQIADYERSLVIVADREKARYFTFHGDELEDEGEFFHEHVPQKMKGRNFEEREKQIDRHIQDHLHRHFKTISEKVVAYTKDRPITAVIVGGHQETISYLYKHLPKSLSDKIIGEFPAEPDADFNELQVKSKEILQSLREKSHSQPSTNLNL